MKRVDLGGLGLDRGGHLLVKRALAGVLHGEAIAVTGGPPDLLPQLNAFCRLNGHLLEILPAGELVVRRGTTDDVRRRTAGRIVGYPPATRPPATWGLAARGATIEDGSPPFEFSLDDKDAIWSDDAARIYAQAASAQWDPATAVPWDAPFELLDDVEDAVVQVMTYLVENETAALVVPARFLGKIHPHFREVVAVLAVQVADEARHIDVFTRRAGLRRAELGLSTAGGQASLKTLLDEPDFALASFLLSVLGEGSFLSLLTFLRDHAPDPITRRVAELSGQDEARHVAFGLSHLERHVGVDPRTRERLAAAIRRRHDALAHTSGLNDEVFDALVLLGAGSYEPAAIARGWDAVVRLTTEMDAGRRRRLLRLGFTDVEAEELSSLHTRNFM